MFSNAIIDPTTLPKLPADAFQKLPQAYRKQRFLAAGLLSLMIGMACFVVLALSHMEWQVPSAWVAGAIVTVGVLTASAFLVAEMGYRKMGYLLRQHDISYRSGWLLRSQVTVPMSRIQHSEIFRGPLDRWLGLSTLRIFTAGSSGANLSIPGLKAETAHALRRALLEHEHGA